MPGSVTRFPLDLDKKLMRHWMFESGIALAATVHSATKDTCVSAFWHYQSTKRLEAYLFRFHPLY